MSPRNTVLARSIVLMVSLLPVGSSPAIAATFTVTNTNASGSGSLPDAIAQANAANGPHTINITASGTLNLTSPLQLIQYMTINGPVATPPSFAIDGGNTTLLVQVVPTAVGPMALNYLTLTHGRRNAASGGAIEVRDGKTLTISHCLVTANSTTGTSSSDPLIAAGGALTNIGNLIIDSSTFSDNSSAGPGGAIYSGLGSTIYITNSLFTNNRALSAWAGAMYCDSAFGVTIFDSTFSSNQSGPGGGGAIGFFNAIARISGTTFNNNTTAGDGGAMTNSVAQGEMIGIENSTISGNSATGTTSTAGAIYAKLGVTDLRSVTITANSAATGGAIYNPGSSIVQLRNTIIAGNTATQASPDCSGPVSSGGYNLVGNSSGCVGLAASDITGVPPYLGLLANNGGPTQTQLLFSVSLAIEGGNPSGCVGLAGASLTVDQRGSARPSGSRCDIGAVEMSGIPPKLRRHSARH